MLFGLKFKEVKETKSALPEGMTLAQVRAAMLQLMAEENTNHYRMGQLYNYVVDNKLAENAGHKNAPEYFSKELADLPASSLRMYGAVAGSFSEPVCVRFGVTCLSLLLGYKEAAGVQVNHEEPGGTLIEVPGENGAVKAKPFSQCTVNDMRKALQARRKPTSSKPLPDADLALANQVREAVTGRFPKEARVRVQLRNDKGTPVLDFKGVPLADVAKLAEALEGEPTPLSQ
jgi:hypothetical protein